MHTKNHRLFSIKVQISIRTTVNALVEYGQVKAS